MEEAEVPLEHLHEEIHHSAEHGGETWISWVALSTAILAVLAAIAGLLSGKKATTHYLSINDFHAHYPDVVIEKNVRFVEYGNFITTGGVTSGIDGALHLVRKIDGEEIAQHVADVIVYNRETPLPPFTILPPYYTG